MWKLLFLTLFAVTIGHPALLTLEKAAVSTSNILKNGTSFYQVGTGDSQRYLYINASYDLLTWQDYPVMNESNKPLWSNLQANKNNTIKAPEIALLKDQPRIYFAARHTGVRGLAISVAYTDFLSTKTSDLPLWPTLSAPLVLNETQGVTEPTIASSWNGYYDGVALFYSGVIDKALYAAELSKDGLTVDKFRGEVLSGTLAWEDGQVSKAHVVKNGEYFYLFYVGNSQCSDETAIGVARSQSVFGPYEKRAEPLAISKNFGDNSALCGIHPRDVVSKMSFLETEAWPRVM